MKRMNLNNRRINSSIFSFFFWKKFLGVNWNKITHTDSIFVAEDETTDKEDIENVTEFVTRENFNETATVESLAEDNITTEDVIEEFTNEIVAHIAQATTETLILNNQSLAVNESINDLPMTSMTNDTNKDDFFETANDTSIILDELEADLEEEIKTEIMDEKQKAEDLKEEEEKLEIVEQALEEELEYLENNNETVIAIDNTNDFKEEVINQAEANNTANATLDDSQKMSETKAEEMEKVMLDDFTKEKEVEAELDAKDKEIEIMQDELEKVIKEVEEEENVVRRK